MDHIGFVVNDFKRTFEERVRKGQNPPKSRALSVCNRSRRYMNRALPSGLKAIYARALLMKTGGVGPSLRLIELVLSFYFVPEHSVFNLKRNKLEKRQVQGEYDGYYLHNYHSIRAAEPLYSVNEACQKRWQRVPNILQRY